MKKNLIFDYGNVLVGYDPHVVYDPFFGDTGKTTWFLQNILTEEWTRKMDTGFPTFRECINILKGRHPEYVEAIELYDSRYLDMITGEIPGMYKLLSSYKSRGWHIYGLTNWSGKVYEVLQKYPIFSLIDGMVISSEVNLLKPDTMIYRKLLAKYALQADECIFIDDRQENVETAKQLGMSGIVFENAAQLEQQLFELERI